MEEVPRRTLLACKAGITSAVQIYAGSGLPQGPFWKTTSTPLKRVKNGVLSMSRSGSKVGAKVGFDLLSYTICACRALVVGKQGFAQGKNLRVCGEFFSGVHGKLPSHLSKVWCSR